MIDDTVTKTKTRQKENNKKQKQKKTTTKKQKNKQIISSHQSKLSEMEGGEPTSMHFLSTNRWTNAGTNVKLLLQGWYQASDPLVCRLWRFVRLLHGSTLPATPQQGEQMTLLHLCIRHCELPSFFPRPVSEHTPSQKQRPI